MKRRDWLRSVAYGATPLLIGRTNLRAQGSPRERNYRSIHLDVFTDRRLAGNQLLVHLSPEGLDAFVAADKAGSIVNAQGVLVKRPSRIHIRIVSASGEVSQVKVGGASVVVGEGTASL